MSYHRIGKDGTKYWGKKGAGILFTDGKSMLLLKRAKGTDNANKWGLPGGKTESGESDIAAAIRETKEETGLDKIPGHRIDSFVSVDGRHRFVTFLYRVNEQFQDVSLSDEHSDWKWVDLNDLTSEDLHPKLEVNLPRYIRLIRRKVKNFNEWQEISANLSHFFI